MLLLFYFTAFTAAACSPEPQRQTDVRRKIKDSWVDWDDHIEAWQRLNVEGQNIIAAIANTKLTAVYVKIYRSAFDVSFLCIYFMPECSVLQGRVAAVIR